MKNLMISGVSIDNMMPVGGSMNYEYQCYSCKKQFSFCKCWKKKEVKE